MNFKLVGGPLDGDVYQSPLNALRSDVIYVNQLDAELRYRVVDPHVDPALCAYLTQVPLAPWWRWWENVRHEFTFTKLYEPAA